MIFFLFLLDFCSDETQPNYTLLFQVSKLCLLDTILCEVNYGCKNGEWSIFLDY